MALAVLFALGVVGAGLGVVRLLGPGGCDARLGLAPAAGLAVLAVVSSWCALMGVPAPLAGLVVTVLALGGWAFELADRRALAAASRTVARKHRLAAALVAAAFIVPLIAMGFAFAGVEVPLSPHDGAWHTENIQAFRLGKPDPGWYPPGTAALFAAWLQMFPWIDSAQGAFDLGLGLPSLAALAVFGVAGRLWRDPRIAALAALLLGLTYLYPYFPQIWSGWPLTVSITLALGVWTVALEYVDRPSARWAILAGLELGAIVLVHGSELYTLVVLLPIVAIGARRHVIWRDLPGVIGLAMLVALLCAAIYLPTLLHWVETGGAYAIGLDETRVLAPSTDAASTADAASIASGPGLFATFALDAFGIDLPIRVILVAVGIVWSVQQRAGRSVLVVGLVFAGIAIALNAFTGVELFRQIYALTFPWGMHYRLLMLVSIAQALLAGAGGVVLIGQVHRWAGRPTAWGRRLGRLSRLLVLTWLGLTTWGLVVSLAYPARLVLGYDADDAAAMAWLRANASPGAVLLNDGYADAGIWAPYKAGIALLLPRSATLSTSELSRRLLVWQHIDQLDRAPEAAAAACAEGVRYVLRGSATSAWDERRLPPAEVLRASPALEEVFRQGEARIFRTRLDCP